MLYPAGLVSELRRHSISPTKSTGIEQGWSMGPGNYLVWLLHLSLLVIPGFPWDIYFKESLVLLCPLILLRWWGWWDIEKMEGGFNSWCGYAMNQRHSLRLGFQSNAVEYLTKDLMINWRVGKRVCSIQDFPGLCACWRYGQYFLQQLINGDLALNSGGWQWSVSVGVDPCPYFRIFLGARRQLVPLICGLNKQSIQIAPGFLYLCKAAAQCLASSYLITGLGYPNSYATNAGGLCKSEAMM